MLVYYGNIQCISARELIDGGYITESCYRNWVNRGRIKVVRRGGGAAGNCALVALNSLPTECLERVKEDNPGGTEQALRHWILSNYVLDEEGNRIRDANGKYVFNAVPTTDWGSPETLEHWREAWAEMCNAKFAEKGLDVRIDHRSYERQGVDLLPTIHEGATVRAMEKKGIAPERAGAAAGVASQCRCPGRPEEILLCMGLYHLKPGASITSDFLLMPGKDWWL